MEFIFSQTAPVVCLLCKQTYFTKRIIALFRVLLYRVHHKKLFKIENTRLGQLELEFSFSFNQLIRFQIYLNKSHKLKVVLWYTLLYAALFGFLIHPIPFLPYPGMTAFFTALLTFPVVLAFMLLLILGFLIPNLMISPPLLIIYI